MVNHCPENRRGLPYVGSNLMALYTRKNNSDLFNTPWTEICAFKKRLLCTTKAQKRCGGGHSSLKTEWHDHRTSVQMGATWRRSSCSLAYHPLLLLLVCSLEKDRPFQCLFFSFENTKGMAGAGDTVSAV